MKYVTRALREIYLSLTSAGWVWLGLPMMGPPLPMAETRLKEPPAGHPERLCADVPLTSTERALQRQLVPSTGERE
ncbi:DUF6059 family protein [Streptomyces sp. NBC_01012]|uniref:DUF6059 family protein n=1 Tax=Streptomyces sp. NBC_01012 TaxID=2903717 RepID=UPI00386687EC|nr:hypothetical protein OG623_10215 [Streptomyces sp. NBC_01012]